ncbi:hypothetical protein [Streptomyces sp. NPDC086023]|uniref:hypothetical protein n=1 Tax=Streptomyces sp. NPDC086023 TaxID=3365746 RepID=UPI0037D7A5D1
MSGTEVTVVVSDCAEDDARTVLTALGETFTPDRAPSARSGGRATVWSSTFDVAHPKEHAAHAVPLEHPVTVTAQGGYGAVDRVVAELGTVFAIDAQGSAAGDQEKDVHLRLHGR